MTMSSVKSANSMPGVSRLKICWSISSKATRHAWMLNLWTTSRRRRTYMKREDRLSINSSWIGPLTSSRPGKNLNSGVRGQLKKKETIISLQAQVKSLIFNQKKSDVNGKSVAARKDQKKANKKGKGKFKPEDKPALMRTPPNEGERHSKTVEGKDYHWCPDHESWTRRKPSECKGIGFTKTQAKKDLDKVSDSKPKMKLSPPSPPMKNDGHAQ